MKMPRIRAGMRNPPESKFILNGIRRQKGEAANRGGLCELAMGGMGSNHRLVLFTHALYR